jgi:nicotinamide phosphoribosyltransferase
MKTNEVTIDGVRVDVQKRPKTDMKKASKAGRQAVVSSNGVLISVREADLQNSSHGTRNYLEPVWKNGETIRQQTFNEVRELAKLK